MRYVKLGDIATPKQWKTISSKEMTLDGYPVYGANGNIGFYSEYNHEKETLLITCRGATCGKVNISVPYSYINGNAMALDNLSSEVLIKFMYYYFINRGFQDIISGSAQPQIIRSSLSQITIPLPPIDEQRRIADTLDRCRELMDIRKKQLDELDTLVKSRFVEMFGDPVENPMGWEVNPVINYCNFMVPGRNKPKSFTGKTPWITIDDLVVNGYTEKSKKKLGLTKEEIIFVKRKTIPTGSVIMSCVGNLGICSIASKPLIINQQLHSFQCKEQINNLFLMHYLGFRTDYMIKMASSTTVLYMNKSVCNSIPVYLPPLSLQNEFADFVAKTEAIRENLQKSLDTCETLYKSKMQEFFMPQK